LRSVLATQQRGPRLVRRAAPLLPRGSGPGAGTGDGLRGDPARLLHRPGRRCRGVL